jgi:hypothetical protein
VRLVEIEGHNGCAPLCHLILPADAVVAGARSCAEDNERCGTDDHEGSSAGLLHLLVSILAGDSIERR